jgi:WD40 repeat protein
MSNSAKVTAQDRANSLFISYCRRDISFVKQLDAALRETGLDPWVDWEDIYGAEEWRNAIAKGIVGADTFVYVISPDSVESVECGKELDQAIALNKRIVPLLHRMAPNVHPSLAKLNWIFFRETDDFDTALHTLIDVINTDLDYVRTHTRLLQRAGEWEDNHREDSYLLRGIDLAASEAWLYQEILRDPQPTELHKNYIAKSREAEDAHNRVVAAGEQAKRMVRLGSVVLAATLSVAAVTAGLTLWSWQKLTEARIGAQLEKASANVLRQFDFAPLPALVKALENGQILQDHVQAKTPLDRYPSIGPLLALATILDNIQEQNQVPTSPTTIRQVIITPDGQSFITAGDSGTVEIWDFMGRRLQAIDTSLPSIFSLAVSPDGQRLAVGGESGVVEVLLISGKSLARFQTHTARVSSISFSPTQNLMATASTDGVARLWNLDGQPFAEFSEHAKNNAEVLSVSFSPDGQQLVSVGVDSIIRLWDLAGNQTQSIGAERLGVLYDASFSPDGKQVAVAGLTGDIQLWTLSTKAVETFSGHQGEVLTVSFSADGQILVSTGVDSTIRLWHRDKGSVEVLKGHQDWVYSASLSSDNQRLVSGGVDGHAHIWTLAKRGQAFAGHTRWVDDLVFSPKGDFLATAGEDGTVKLWDTQGKVVANFAQHHQPVNGVAVNPAGDRLATVGFDDTLRIWDTTGKAVATFPLEQQIGWSVAFDKTGERLLTGGEDGSIIIWNASGKQGQMEGHSAPVGAIRFSADGQFIATASNDKTARIWRSDGTPIHVLSGHVGAVHDVALSPDGKYVATASGDGTVKLWTIEGKLVHTLIGHLGTVKSVDFTPNSQLIASAGLDGMARLWTISGYQLTEWRTDKRLTRVRLNSQGTQMAVSGEEGFVQTYPIQDLSLDGLMHRGCEWLKDYFIHGQPDEHSLSLCR